MENKKKNKKNYLYFLLGAAGTAVAVYAADKYIPGFNEKITKPVMEFAKKSASNVKNYLMADNSDTKKVETKEELVEKTVPEKRRKFSYKEVNDDRRYRNRHHHNHRQQREKKF